MSESYHILYEIYRNFVYSTKEIYIDTKENIADIFYYKVTKVLIKDNPKGNYLACICPYCNTRVFFCKKSLSEVSYYHMSDKALYVLSWHVCPSEEFSKVKENESISYYYCDINEICYSIGEIL